MAGATRFRKISDKLYIDGNKLYCKMGFSDRTAPESMSVLHRTEKIMCITLN